MLSPKKLLENARNRISKRENWVRGSLAKPSQDSHTRVHPTSPEASCWCAIGAVAAESGVRGAYSTRGHHGEALKALARAAGFEDSEYEFDIFSTIYGVNDTKGHEAVLEMFDTAIANMKGE